MDKTLDFSTLPILSTHIDTTAIPRSFPSIVQNNIKKIPIAEKNEEKTKRLKDKKNNTTLLLVTKEFF